MSGQADKEIQRKIVRARRVAKSAGIMQGVLAMLRPGDLAIDCGANVGAVTLPLARTGANVIAYEPDPVAFAELSSAVEAHHNVTLHHTAVGVQTGQARLFRGERFEDNPVVSSRRSTIVPGANRVEDTNLLVDVIDFPAQLQELCKRPGGVAFLKLDVEGAELDVLTEMLRLKLFDHVRLTVAELHGYKFPDLKEEFVALRKTLNQKFDDGRVFLDWV